MKTVTYFGPPGTGKTTKALEVLDELLAQGSPPDSIAFLTFSKKARQQAKDRMMQHGITEQQIPFVKTIHALCYHALGLKEGDVLTRKTGGSLMDETGIELDDQWDAEQDLFVSTSRSTERKMIDCYGIMRAMMLETSFEEIAKHGDSYVKHARWLIETYESYKRRTGLLDFTDFLSEFIARDLQLPIEYLIVDEAQDLSSLQWKVIYTLAKSLKELHVFGDDDQAIFTFAGANPTMMLRLPKAEQVVLSQSHRIPASVFRCSQHIIRRVATRKAKHFLPRQELGLVQSTYSLNKAQLHAHATNMILYRHHYSAKKIAQELIAMGIPFMGLHSPYRHQARLTALYHYHQESMTAKQARSLSRFLVYPLPINLDEFRANHEIKWSSLFRQRRPWAEVFKPFHDQEVVGHLIDDYGVDILTTPPTTTLASIHQSKGGEAEQVWLYPDMSGRAYRALHMLHDPTEHRVFYVGATRAKHTLHIMQNTSERYYEVPL